MAFLGCVGFYNDLSLGFEKDNNEFDFALQTNILCEIRRLSGKTKSVGLG